MKLHTLAGKTYNTLVLREDGRGGPPLLASHWARNMGIRFNCPNGHKLNVKSFQAGRKGICPFCGAKVQIPTESTRKSSAEEKAERELAPVQIFGAEPGEPPPSRPEVSTPAVQPQSNAASGRNEMPSRYDPAPNMRTNRADISTKDPDSPAPRLEIGMVAEIPTAVPLEPAPVGPGVSDPLAEAPNAVWYVRPPGGGQFGPAPGDVMRAWIAEGRVAPEAVVWREGWRDWREASSVFPQLAPEPAIAGLEQITAAAPTASETAHHHQHGGSRRRSNTVNMIVITVLVLAVIVLFAVFVWVLTNQPAP